MFVFLMRKASERFSDFAAQLFKGPVLSLHQPVVASRIDLFTDDGFVVCKHGFIPAIDAPVRNQNSLCIRCAVKTGNTHPHLIVYGK